MRLALGASARSASSSFSPDGRYLALDNRNRTNKWDIGILDIESGEVSDFLVTDFHERRPVFSADGRWIAYQSDESGRDEVYVRPFPDTGGRWQVSVEGGRYPRWSSAGNEILFRSRAGIEIARLSGEGQALQIGRPEILVAGNEQEISVHSFFPMFDISPDGQTILLFRDAQDGEADQAQIQAVFNWFDELNELVPIGD